MPAGNVLRRGPSKFIHDKSLICDLASRKRSRAIPIPWKCTRTWERKKKWTPREAEVIYVHLRCSFAFSLFARGIGLESSTRFVSLKIAENAANKTQEIQFPRYVTAPRLICMCACTTTRWQLENFLLYMRRKGWRITARRRTTKFLPSVRFCKAAIITSHFNGEFLLSESDFRWKFQADARSNSRKDVQSWRIDFCEIKFHEKKKNQLNYVITT